MDKQEKKHPEKSAVANILEMVRQLLLGALVISAVGIIAYASLLIMMYFI